MFNFFHNLKTKNILNDWSLFDSKLLKIDINKERVYEIFIEQTAIENILALSFKKLDDNSWQVTYYKNKRLHSTFQLKDPEFLFNIYHISIQNNLALFQNSLRQFDWEESDDLKAEQKALEWLKGSLLTLKESFKLFSNNQNLLPQAKVIIDNNKIQLTLLGHYIELTKKTKYISMEVFQLTPEKNDWINKSNAQLGQTSLNVLDELIDALGDFGRTFQTWFLQN